MSQRAWETAMGMRCYAGSPAQQADRKLGLVVGGQCRWLVEPNSLPGTITNIEIDEDGDPWFHLEFPAHKPVRAEREEISTALPTPTEEVK